MLNFCCLLLIEVVIGLYIVLCEVDDLFPAPFQSLQLSNYCPITHLYFEWETSYAAKNRWVQAFSPKT